MKLKYIKIENFRVIKQLELYLHPQLTVLHGDNATGKTALLDALAVGLGPILKHLPDINGISFKKYDLRQKAPYVRVELRSYEDIRWDCRQRLDKTSFITEALPKKIGLVQLKAYLDNIINGVQNDQSVILPVLVYYGAERIAFSFPENRKVFTRFGGLQGALDGKINLSTTKEWFITKESEEARESKERNNFNYKFHELEIVRQAVEKTFNKCKNLRSKINPPRLLIDFQNKTTLEISQLSHGFRTMLGLVMDLARRMVQANSHLDNPLNTEAIVLIDEIDLHLHPKWQQTILPDLMQTFPNVQFIVTTHSPQILTTIHKENIWQLEHCEEHGVCAYHPIIDPYGAESTDALHSIMSVDPRPQNLPEVKKYNQYLSLVNNGEYASEEAVKLRSELEKALEKNQFHIADMLIRKHKVLNS